MSQRPGVLFKPTDVPAPPPATQTNPSLRDAQLVTFRGDSVHGEGRGMTTLPAFPGKSRPQVRLPQFPIVPDG